MHRPRMRSGIRPLRQANAGFSMISTGEKERGAIDSSQSIGRMGGCVVEERQHGRMAKHFRRERY